jgi:hypothetical protein
MGKDAEGAITRSPYNSDLAGCIPLFAKVNAIFKQHSNGRDLSDVPARAHDVARCRQSGGFDGPGKGPWRSCCYGYPIRAIDRASNSTPTARTSLCVLF